jgi:hypothetical protein
VVDRAGRAEADLEALVGLDKVDVLVVVDNASPASWPLVDFDKRLVSQNESGMR